MIRTSPWLVAPLAACRACVDMVAPDARASGGALMQFEGMPIVQTDASGAAGNLRATADCSSTEMRKAAVTLEWSVAQPKGSQQRVLVSVYGFREGKFEASEPLAPDQSTLAWSRVARPGDPQLDGADAAGRQLARKHRGHLHGTLVRGRHAPRSATLIESSG